MLEKASGYREVVMVDSSKMALVQLTQHPSVCRGNRCLLLVKGGHLSHEGLMTFLKGDRRGQWDLPCTYPLSKSFSLKYSICQHVIFWGSVS